jgi:hypothetical protein
MRMKGLALAAAMLAAAAAGFAQDARETAVYKVDFTMHDSADVSAKNGRKYSLLINGRNKSVMKVGNRVPAATGGSPTQFTYIDVGTNIECVVDERNGKYVLHASMDMSTVIPPDKSGTGGPNPTISQIKIDMETTVTPGKPTVVASFDDPATSRKFDVDVMMTKL